MAGANTSKIRKIEKEGEWNESGNRDLSIALFMNDLEEKNDKNEKISDRKTHVSDEVLVAHDVAPSRAIELRVTRLAACLFPHETIIAREISTIVLGAVKASDENYEELEGQWVCSPIQHRFKTQ